MKLLTTYNLQLTTRKKAFTLMEVLIAAGIFAIVMVITVGILGQSSTFRSKINAQREASESAKMLADKISRDVRESGFPAKITLCNNKACSAQQEKVFKSGIAIIKGQGVIDSDARLWGSFVNDSEAVNSFAKKDYGTQGQILITTTKDKYKVYFSSYIVGVHKAVFYKEYQRLNPGGELVTLTSADIGTTRGKDRFYEVDNLITNRIKQDVSTFFSGYAPYEDATVKQQPYVQFYLISQTKNYDSLLPNFRAKIEIRSAVTARSFAD